MNIGHITRNPGSDDVFDLVIIGGGPGGFSAAIYAARANLRTLVIDRNPVAGALGITSRIENYPGIPGRLSGTELLSIFRKQAESFGACFLRTRVVGVNLEEEVKETHTMEGTFRSRAVIVATGAMGRKPTIDGEAKFVGKGVSYCVVCDAPFFRDSVVALVGETGDAIDELEVLVKFAAKVYLITRNRSIAAAVEKDFHGSEKIELLEGFRVKTISGDATVSNLKIADRTGNEKKIDVSGVFVYLAGTRPIVDFLGEAVEIHPEGCIAVNREDMSTSIEGVYAIGDVTCNRFRQVVIAAADGCIAALSVDGYLRNRRKSGSANTEQESEI